MPEVDLIAVSVATVASFGLGGAYYGVLGGQLAELSGATGSAAEQPAPWTIAVELLRCLVTAAVVAGLASQGEIDELAGGLLLGLVLWAGFPLVLWTGAVIHEGTPWRLAALHAGDWLLKLIVLGAIASVWP